jgi:hypothetical protein
MGCTLCRSCCSCESTRMVLLLGVAHRRWLAASGRATRRRHTTTTRLLHVSQLHVSASQP